MTALASTREESADRAEGLRASSLHSSYGRSVLGRELDRWSARNSSKGSLLAESIKCLQFLSEGNSVGELHHAIQDEDLLGKRTWEARRTYWRLISWRFFTPGESPVVTALTALAHGRTDDAMLRGALYFHFCLADRLTFEVASQLLWSLQQRGREVVTSPEVEAFIRDGAGSHPEVLSWSDSTLRKLGSAIPSALRDFGRLTGRAKKSLAQPPLSDDLLLYICKFLSAEGVSAREIVGAPDFRLWGRDRREIAARLSELSRSGVIRFEWSGDIAIMDLGEETFEAYARRLGQQVH